MDYKKIYNQIIKRAKTRRLEGYVEKHHIIPKCIGGSNKKENIVQLTAREHFLCHLLLVEIYDEPKLKHALFLMSIGKQKTKDKHFKISNRIYERLRLEYSLFLTGKKQSDKTKKKKSDSMLIVWTNKTKKEKSKIGKKRWKTRVKNGTNNVTTQQAENISKALQGREIKWDTKRKKYINQYDLQGKFIKEWPSIAEAERKIKGDIRSVLSGRQKKAGGFKWKYKI